MPAANICLDCNRLYPYTTHTHGRCVDCYRAYQVRRNATKTRAPHKRTPQRQLRDRFYSTTAWKKARTLAIARDYNQCTTCGSPTDLTVHHINSISTHPELALELDNLTTICRSCHAQESNRRTRRPTT